MIGHPTSLEICDGACGVSFAKGSMTGSLLLCRVLSTDCRLCRLHLYVVPTLLTKTDHIFYLSKIREEQSLMRDSP